MQTVLESLEQAYINILNLEDEANRENTGADTYIREEVYCAKSELIKSIVLLILNNSVQPMDKRVYLDLINCKIFRDTQQEVKDRLIQILYNDNILVREKTIGEVISILSKYGENTPCYIDEGKVIIGKFAYLKLPKADYKIEE